MRQRNLGNVKGFTSANGATMMTSNDGGRAAPGLRSADGGASTSC